MLIIGLCGTSGSGKGTVCASFAKFGISSIDADAVYRDLTQPSSKLLTELAEQFGYEILNSDKSLNRKALSKIVFEDASKELQKKLNKITHKSIIEETEKRISLLEKSGARAVIFDAPLLFESGFDKKCDIIIAVTAPVSIKTERIIQRDSIDRRTAELRLNSQIPEKILKERADYVIDNSGNFRDIDDQVEKIIKILF